MIKASSALRAALTDPERPGSVADRSRTRRRDRLLATFPEISDMTVLDLGGTAAFWQHMQITPASLTLLNVVDMGGPGARMVVGDACAPPPETFDWSYDLVISNSVIDQIGGSDRRQRLADLIRRTAPCYWVQTANRGFPLDPYFLFPWFSRLPVAARVAIVQHWRLTHMHTRDAAEARERVLAIELQSRTDMRALFPDATLLTERFFGAARSLIAARTVH